nr:MAG TPA: hypothetical protein [Bacteriophage sp.]
MVKKKNIGQSAAKLLKIEERSTTSKSFIRRRKKFRSSGQLFYS